MLHPFTCAVRSTIMNFTCVYIKLLSGPAKCIFFLTVCHHCRQIKAQPQESLTKKKHRLVIDLGMSSDLMLFHSGPLNNNCTEYNCPQI